VLQQKVASPKKHVREKLCADAGYTGAGAEAEMRSAGYEPHVRPRGGERTEKIQNPTYKPRHWVVEVCHAWMNRFRKLLVRYEKLTATYVALLHLASAIVALRKIGIIYG
jgi:IS5 family transposase